MTLKTILFALFCICISGYSQHNNYDVGIGISDITGQIAQTNFFGYAKPFFKNAGIRDRQYARAFAIKGSNNALAVFVVIDKGHVSESINQKVLERLSEKFGNVITDRNLIISATHTHVSPGGYSFYDLYNTSTGGFYKTNFDIAVDGIYDAIHQAYTSMAPGRIYYNKGRLENASINRSLVAYNNNKDANDYDTIDADMTVLKFIQGNKEIGMISWFAVHPTSLSQKYKLCSGDNKGYASLKFERLKKSAYTTNDNFVAAFANTNAGDMSPNLNLPPKHNLYKDATGPGKNEEESANIIGDRQFQKALELYENASEQLVGSIMAVSRYSDFSSLEIAPEFTDGVVRSTCSAALGISFRAGAEDGRSGIGREGKRRSNPNTGSSLDRCHGYKPIDRLFNLGKDNEHPKSPKILPTSIFKIGQLGILAAPGEFTIMAGRRARKAVVSRANTGIKHTVLCGYSDSYAGYVTTKEEYDTQHYEGASTHFGPWTSAAYTQEFFRLAQKIAQPKSNPWNSKEPKVPVKKPLSNDKTVTIFYDSTPVGVDFGDAIVQPKTMYTAGDTVSAVFWGAHPNNDTKTNDTYLAVQKWENNKWLDVYYDRDTCTKLVWKRYGIAFSKIEIYWTIPKTEKRGYYRIVHFGNWKNRRDKTISPYTAVSREFLVNPSGFSSKNSIFSPKVPLEVEQTDKNIYVYPNPTQGTLTILNKHKLSGSYTLYTILGMHIASGVITKNTVTTPLKINGHDGVYILKVSCQNGTTYYKQIIKQIE